MIHLLTIKIHSIPGEDGLKLHVRHEGPDGLWDMKDTTVGAASEAAALERILDFVPSSVAEVVGMYEARTSQTGPP